MFNNIKETWDLVLQEKLNFNHFKICIEQTPNEADSDGYSATASPVLITHFMLDKRFVYISEPLTP